MGKKLLRTVIFVKYKCLRIGYSSFSLSLDWGTECPPAKKEIGPNFYSGPFPFIGINAQTFPLARALTISHIHHVDIRSETHVVGQVPAVVVRIVIDHDVVRAPVPIITVTEIIRRN